MRKITLSLLLCLVMTTGMAQTEGLGSVTFRDRREVDARSAAIDPLAYSKWRFSIDLAFTYRVARAVDTGNQMADDFIRRMRSGIVYGIDGHYFVNKDWGVGLRLSHHYYSNTEMGVGDVTNNFYAAPSFVYRSFTNSGNGAWVIGASIGYLSYNEKISEFGNTIAKISKGAVGSTLDVGYDLRLGTGNTFLGFRITLFAGTAMITYNQGENLNAIDLGIGLRF